MSEVLGALYHWSPRDRRDSIRREGLVPGGEPATSTASIQYVCLGPTPSRAWSLSGDMEWMGEIEEWDLWQVRLVDGDHVLVRSDFGPAITEVKVHNVIPPDRVWWVGERTPWLTS